MRQLIPTSLGTQALLLTKWSTTWLPITPEGPALPGRMTLLFRPPRQRGVR
ncbi:hypothetical protein LINGRAHAP2_LOCUS36574 [Linum grandiflorum]